MKPPKPLSYSESGVDIERAQRAKERIRELARATFTPEVLGEIGSFAGLYRPRLAERHRPVLVSSVDGVGTKLKVAFQSGIHNTVGIDLVAHSSNDILAQGAFPLFFLDYIGCGRLEEGVIAQIVEGLCEGCRQSGCPLLGGETAEMPGFYAPGEYDLVGFIVGMAEESACFQYRQAEAGDVLIGLASSGLHTNGYSLARQIFFEVEKLDLDAWVDQLGRTVGEELLAPHRNYLPLVRELVRGDDLHAIAHITGGGITENLARVLPQDLDAVIERGSWEILPVFRFLRERGRVAGEEMYRTFNMGLGMILVAARTHADRVVEYLARRGEACYRVGEVRPGAGRVIYT